MNTMPITQTHPATDACVTVHARYIKRVWNKTWGEERWIVVESENSQTVRLFDNTPVFETLVDADPNILKMKRGEEREIYPRLELLVKQGNTVDWMVEQFHVLPETDLETLGHQRRDTFDRLNDLRLSLDLSYAKYNDICRYYQTGHGELDTWPTFAEHSMLAWAEHRKPFRANDNDYCAAGDTNVYPREKIMFSSQDEWEQSNSDQAEAEAENNATACFFCGKPSMSVKGDKWLCETHWRQSLYGTLPPADAPVETAEDILARLESDPFNDGMIATQMSKSELATWFPRDENGKPLPDAKKWIDIETERAQFWLDVTKRPGGFNQHGIADHEKQIEIVREAIGGHVHDTMLTRLQATEAVLEYLKKKDTTTVAKQAETAPATYWYDDPAKVQALMDKLIPNAVEHGIKPGDMKASAMAALEIDEWSDLGDDVTGSQAYNIIAANWREADEFAKHAPLPPAASEPVGESKLAPQTSLALVPPTPVVNAVAPVVAQWDVMRQQAEVLIKSGFLPTAIKTPEQAITIMMMGAALNIEPIVALNTINVISGKPTVSPQLMLALVRRSGQLETFQVADDGDTCTVNIKRRGEPMHIEKFSMEDAKRMKTTEYVNGNKTQISLSEKYNWKSQPAVMRKWRAIAAACRVVFPDITWGIASYTAEEIDPDFVIEDAA